MCVSCVCRDGLVNREEITAYFMRASVICSKLGLGFVHNFQETTYMKPTFCDNCSGFVSDHTNATTREIRKRANNDSPFIYKLQSGVYSII